MPWTAPGQHQTVDEVSVYDAVEDAWTHLPDLAMPEPRDHAGGASVDDVLYLIDGKLTSDTVFSLNLSDIEAGRDVLSGRAPTPRGGHMAAAVGKVFTRLAVKAMPIPNPLVFWMMSRPSTQKRGFGSSYHP